MKKLNRLSAIIALILIAAFILPSTAVIAAANDSNLVYFYGDLNANGEIDKFDYILIKRSCMNTLSLTDEQISRGDVNNNGDIDKFDYILVKRHVMGTYTIPMVTLCEHELESIKAKDATCDKNGNIAYFYCVKCEKCYSDADATNEITPESTVIAAKGHDYTEPKNDENGSWKECVCGAKSETTAHSFGAWATVVESTCTEQGTRMRVCITCGYIASEKLPLLEHTYGDWLNDTENHWKECVCGKKSETIAHTYGEWETVTEPTCTETGVKKRICTICEYSQTGSISVVSHTYGEWETVTKPTCTNQGTKKRACVDCGHTETDVIAILPHSYNKTNYNSSTHWKECVCGKKSETIAHTYTDVVTPPTESKQGFTTHTCNVCGHSYKDSYVKPTASVGLAYTVNDDGITCTVTGIGTCKDTELIIPSKIDGYKVTSIGEEAFDRCYNLTSITIPDSVTLIGDIAFSGCTKLTNITIPDSVTSIGDNAFDYCDNLIDVYYQGNVENWLSIQFEDYFSNPCCYAENLYFNDVLVTELVIPDSVTSIGDSAFSNCDNLTSITIPDSVTSIGDEAFDYCDNLTSIVIPDSVTSIGDYAFKGCDNLKNVTIGNGVTSIGDWSFAYCTGLTSITIPDSVTSIGDDAFCGCDNLTSITIPDSITSIGGYAFVGCDSLKYNVYDNAYYLGNANNPYVVLVKAISKDITSCTISPNTKLIHSDAFYECKKLTSITIPDSVTSIGGDAFYRCSSLKYNVYDNAYYLGNANNPYVVLVKAISKDITSCTINPNTKLIHSDAFYECKKLTSITIPDGVTSIGGDAFRYCTAFTSIIIPDSVTSIGDNAFYYCSGLTSVTIGNSVTSIGSGAFYDCLKLTSITIPDSVTSIGNSAFYWCPNLTSVTIGNSVTSIGDYAFDYCSNLKDVYYAGSQEKWKQIKIGSSNSRLTSATIFYNCKEN